MHRFAATLLYTAAAAIVLMSTSPLEARSEPIELEFAQVDDRSLKLDLYLPEKIDAPGLVVWVHGGAWRKGTRKGVSIYPLLEKGWAIASVDYRLSPEARFPAQMHDIKAAIRFLRAQQENYPYDATNIVIAGESAGGHLAALAGVTNHKAELEGTLGDHLDQDSSIQAIVSYFGASNLMSILGQSTPHGISVRGPALALLLGSLPQENETLAKLASPVFQVDPNDPPCLLIHGDQDHQMPINQSHELKGKYDALGLDCVFEVNHGNAHGGKTFYNEERITLVDTFLRERL